VFAATRMKEFIIKAASMQVGFTVEVNLPSSMKGTRKDHKQIS